MALELTVIALVSLLASGLTLFSGFGLGTLLAPAFVLFFPVDISIGLTAIVHLLNNLFKLALLGRHADRSVARRFGGPAVIAALAGAALLAWLSDLPAIASYRLWDRAYSVAPLKLVVGALMIAFAALELWPRFRDLAFDRRYLPLGGLVSGFLGGLSGHQGALRAAFLVRAGLSKEAFIATGVVIACLVDFTRLAVYARHFALEGVRENALVLATATVAAFAGAFAGSRLIRTVTLSTVRAVVALMLFALGLALAAGLI